MSQNDMLIRYSIDTGRFMTPQYLTHNIYPTLLTLQDQHPYMPSYVALKL